MENVGMKEKVSFTIEKDLMSWFRLYCKEEYKTMSAVLANHILQLKRGAEKPKNLLYLKCQTQHITHHFIIAQHPLRPTAI